MEKIINYTLTAQGVFPAEPQFGGIQGEHRATALIFTPDEELLSTIERAQKNGFEVLYKADTFTASGECFLGEEQDISLLSNPYYLTYDMTCSGLDTVTVLRLILKAENKILNELYRAQIKLYYTASPLSLFTSASNKKTPLDRLNKKAEELLSNFEAKAERANDLLEIKVASASEKVTATAKHLKRVTELAEQTEKTRLMLEKGTEFVFSGGDAAGAAEVYLVIDDKLSDTSENPVQNKVITEAINNTSKELKDLSEEVAQQIKEAGAALLLAAHPVGSLYWSADATEPSLLFGGSWERVKDKFILAAGDSYEAGSTGGEAEHTLTTQELPRHTHSVIKAFGNNTLDSSNQPAWAIKLLESAISNTSANPSTGSDGGIGYAGSGTAHNNMPPYEVYYCWKRTA